MSESMRAAVKEAIREAYRKNMYQYAYYLELCLRTNEAPR